MLRQSAIGNRHRPTFVGDDVPASANLVEPSGVRLVAETAGRAGRSAAPEAPGRGQRFPAGNSGIEAAGGADQGPTELAEAGTSDATVVARGPLCPVPCWSTTAMYGWPQSVAATDGLEGGLMGVSSLEN